MKKKRQFFAFEEKMGENPELGVKSEGQSFALLRKLAYLLSAPTGIDLSLWQI